MKKVLMATAAVVVLAAAVSSAADKPVKVEAEGGAYLGEIDTPKETMARARVDAQNKAVEKAVGVFIKSHTLVSNSQLAEDLVYASVRGKIRKTEIIEEDWDKSDRNYYRVKLRAFVEPVYPEKGGGIAVKLHLSKADLRQGEAVKIFYQSNTDCYVYIFSVAADGSVTLLLPNSGQKDNHIASGKTYEFPSAGDQVQLKAMLLPGYTGAVAEEKIKIIATKQKEDILPLGFQEGMFKVYDSSSTGMISDLVRKLSRMDLSDWAEATAIYRIAR